MTSKEEVFKTRFAAVMADLEDDAGSSEDMTLVGSLADRIVSEAKQPNWTVFKANLSVGDYRGLLSTFQTQGNALAKQGTMSRVRAIEVLACSLISRTQTEDIEVAADDKRLDKLIDAAIQRHRQASPAAPISN